MEFLKLFFILLGTFLAIISLNWNTGVAGHEEFYSAVVHLKQLLNTEHEIVSKLDRYLKHEEKRLAGVRQMLYHYKEIENLANRDVDSYLTNPVNAYLLVKRLTTDWKLVEYLTLNADRKDLIQILNSTNTFPSEDDLTGATEALLRLQDTYKLDTTMLADGVIPPTAVRRPEKAKEIASKVGMSLTSNDCYEIGRQAYLSSDFYHTQLWMEEALNRLDKEDSFIYGEKSNKNRINIMEHLAFSYYKEGHLLEAYDVTQAILKLDPTNDRAAGNLEFYQTDAETRERILQRKGDSGGSYSLDNTNNLRESSYPREETIMQTYEALCRGEDRMPEMIRSKLKCFYLDTRKLQDSYLILTKIKVEEAYTQPQIVLFIDVITDEELDIIKRKSEDKLRRATVHERNSDRLITAKYRISKSAWLTDEEDEIVARVSRRIQSITGLDMSSAEELQVVNYGLGGQYEPHHDHAQDNDPSAFESLGLGNRIATWMNYMSEVTAGGATVFPLIGARIWPRKNSAAFWYNLRASGNGDYLTKHAACPVLLGSKWVSNKWIHEKKQEFRKPCSVNRHDFLYVEKIR